MLILVISDLHIDNGDKLGTFGWEPTEFIRSLEEVVQMYNIDQVILNGDILDLYKYRFTEVYQKNYELINYFIKKGYIFIRGNHDLFNPFARDSFTLTNSKGQTVYIEHGHKADFLNGTRIGRSLGMLGFFLLKKIINIKLVEKIYFKAVEWDDQINHVPKKYNTFKYLNYSLNLLKEYDVVILGHTHKVEAHKTYHLNSKKFYLNSGTCSLGRMQGVILNTETLRYETVKLARNESVKSLMLAIPMVKHLSTA